MPEQKKKDLIANGIVGKVKTSPLQTVLGKEPLKAVLGDKPITKAVKFILGKK